MFSSDDVYYEFTRKRDIRIVKEVAQYLCDRFPQNYSLLVVELCKMFCNQKYDCKYEIDADIAKLPFLLSLEGG